MELCFGVLISGILFLFLWKLILFIYLLAYYSYNGGTL
jgi:hypothetical protein